MPLCAPAERGRDEVPIGLAVIASVRHRDTAYDELLMEGIPRAEARERVRPVVEHLFAGRRTQRSLARRRPPSAVVHTTARPWLDGDVRTHNGIRVTSPERTILDAAETGTQPEQIQMVVAQALQRGWLDAIRLRNNATSRDQRVASLVERALAETGPAESHRR